MAFSEDLTVYLDTVDGFATTATLKNGATIDGIFDNESIEVLDVTSNTPVFTVSTASANTIKRGDSIVLSSVNYKVADKRPDGAGMTDLILERV